MKKKQKFHIYKKKTKITDNMQQYVKTYQYVSDELEFEFDIYTYHSLEGYNEDNELMLDIRNKEALHRIYTYHIKVADYDIIYSPIGLYTSPIAKQEIQTMVKSIPKEYFYKYFLIYNGV